LLLPGPFFLDKIVDVNQSTMLPRKERICLKIFSGDLKKYVMLQKKDLISSSLAAFAIF
jgi:hypothetical protein